MATKIGFKVRDKAIIPDVSPLFDLSKTLLEQEDTREKQRQTWRDEQDALRKSQTELTPTVNQDANQFFGKFSQGIIDESLDLQKMLESGQINSSDYSAQWRNLNQSNEQMIAAQTSYQETAQKITEDVANGISSEVNTKNLNHFNKVFQPGAMEVERDGRGGLRLFNKKTGDIVSPSYLSNLTNSNLPLYDYMKVADTLVKQFGVRGITDAAGNTIKGVYANMDEGKLDELMLIEAKALLDGAQAPIVSILVDGMGHDVVYNEDELKDGSVYRKPDGTFAFSEKDKEKAEVFMRNALKNALPLEKKEAQDLTAVQKEELKLKKQRLALDIDKLNLDKKKFSKEDRDKATDLKTKAQLISTLYSGTIADINATVDYYRDYGGNTNVLEVKRNDTGIVVTFEDENGNAQTRSVSFFTADSTSDTNVPNPDFDPSQPESETNQKFVKGRQLTEAQFVNSASQLLIGEDVSTEIKSRGDDGELLYNRALTSVDSPITATTTIEEGETLAQSETYNVSADQYFDKIIADPEIDFGFKPPSPFSGRKSSNKPGLGLGVGPLLLNSADEDLATVLESSFKDIGLIATDTGGLNNEVNVRIPGVTETITIDANNYTGSGQLEETQKLREFITNALKRSPDLQEKLNLKADVKKRGGRGSKYNKVGG